MSTDKSDESSVDGTSHRRSANDGVLSAVRRLLLLHLGAGPELRSSSRLGGLPAV